MHSDYSACRGSREHYVLKTDEVYDGDVFFFFKKKKIQLLIAAAMSERNFIELKDMAAPCHERVGVDLPLSKFLEYIENTNS